MEGSIDQEMVAMAKKLAAALASDPSKANDPALKPVLSSIRKTIEAAEDSEPDSCFPFCFPTGGGKGGGPSFSAESLGAGCYLVHNEANNGTLVAFWSDAPVQGALAYTQPSREVPRFKFTTNGGKEEIVRGVGGHSKRVEKVYYHGWRDFIRNFVKGFDGSFVVLAPLHPNTDDGSPAAAAAAAAAASSLSSSSSSATAPSSGAAATEGAGKRASSLTSLPLDVGVFLHMRESKRIRRLEAHEMLTSLDGIDGIAVTGYITDAFDGITMNSTMFAEKSSSVGASFMQMG